MIPDREQRPATRSGVRAGGNQPKGGVKLQPKPTLAPSSHDDTTDRQLIIVLALLGRAIEDLEDIQGITQDDLRSGISQVVHKLLIAEEEISRIRNTGP